MRHCLTAVSIMRRSIHNDITLTHTLHLKTLHTALSPALAWELLSYKRHTDKVMLLKASVVVNYGTPCTLRGKKTAQFYFCNNFVKPVIFGTHMSINWEQYDIKVIHLS